jgi:hypothetical protein
MLEDVSPVPREEPKFSEPAHKVNIKNPPPMIGKLNLGAI